MSGAGGAVHRPETGEPRAEILCPMCLSQLDPDEPELWSWDGREYVQLEIPADATEMQRVNAMRGARIRCPDRLSSLPDKHYLPADYVRYGRPAVIGFVGQTTSGKTHLLSSVVGAIEAGELDRFGISSSPLDEAWHHQFLDTQVRPLLEEGKVLTPTPEKVVSFADALLMGTEGGPQRPVALFDVAGGELSREWSSAQGAKKFLEIADGLIFVVDSARLGLSRTGDNTFNTLLGLLRTRLPEVSAAIVVNKADLRRFDDPVTRWLRTDLTGLDPDLIQQESADVFAYLDTFDSSAWVRPYRLCGKGTLHVATATGSSALDGPGSKYPRDVRPRRVLGPLIALLAMTGVLVDERAQRVGA